MWSEGRKECEKIIVGEIREAWDQKGILSEQIRTEELSFLKKNL